MIAAPSHIHSEVVLLTERQAAAAAQVDRRTIRRLILAGRLTATDFGSGKRRCFRIDMAHLKTIQPSAKFNTTQRPSACVRRRRSESTSDVVAFLPSV
jgi:excisionase family DNA binding protein